MQLEPDGRAFRGWVAHRDRIQPIAGGTKRVPITYGGNRVGSFGEGRAGLDGVGLVSG